MKDHDNRDRAGGAPRPLDRETMERVAHLARLDLTPGERDAFGPQLARIVAYADRLAELDTRDVEPFAHAPAASGATRDDDVAPSLPPQEATACAPALRGAFFCVPRVLEGLGTAP